MSSFKLMDSTHTTEGEPAIFTRLGVILGRLAATWDRDVQTALKDARSAGAAEAGDGVALRGCRSCFPPDSDEQVTKSDIVG